MDRLKHRPLGTAFKTWKWGKLLLVVLVMSAPMLGVSDYAPIHQSAVDHDPSVAAQDCDSSR